MRTNNEQFGGCSYLFLFRKIDNILRQESIFLLVCQCSIPHCYYLYCIESKNIDSCRKNTNIVHKISTQQTQIYNHIMEYNR